jgi:RNA polymerase sigma factor for flagellar operon FliA
MATQVVALAKVSGQMPAFLRSRTRKGPVEPGPAPRISVRASRHRQVGAEREDRQRDQLVVNLLPLVTRMALQVRRRLPLQEEIDDLISDGVLGLLDALRKFDTRKRVKFESYARWRIRGAILDGLRSLDSVPRHMRKKHKEAQTLYRALEAKLRRPPSNEEIAQALGVSLEKWYDVAQQHQVVGMDWLRPSGSMGTKDSKAASEETLVADNEGHQFDACYRREQREILDRCLELIPWREREVVQLHYDRNVPLKEIAKKLGCDESRVSQLHCAALAGLRWQVEKLMTRPQSRAPRLRARLRPTTGKTT